MKFPNWFRIGWWCLTTAVLTWVLAQRYSAISHGQATSIDAFLFALWIALMLVPIFTEVSLLGLSFKQQFDELRHFVVEQTNSLRNEVRNANTFSPTIMMPGPPPDSQLPSLEKVVMARISEALASHGIKPLPTGEPTTEPSADAVFLFQTRYAIESELRRLATAYFGDNAPSPYRAPTFKIIQSLVALSVLDEGVADGIRNVLRVCNPAIHGETPTAAQIKFVHEVGPEAIRALHSIG